MAINLASLLQLAASSQDEMDTPVPLLHTQSEEWNPSGLLEKAGQMRDVIEADAKHSRTTGKRKRQGPCIFGCEPKAIMSQNGSIQLYGVSDPSPWSLEKRYANVSALAWKAQRQGCTDVECMDMTKGAAAWARKQY